MANTAERVQTPKGFGFITGRSSDGTVTVTLDNTRILTFPADQVEPLICADVKVGDVFLNIDGERVEVVETSDRTIFFKDELAFRYTVQRALLVRLLADGTWKRPAAPRIANGTYHPNVPGARTIAEARPLCVGGQPVSVSVYDGGVALFHGLRIVYEGPMPDGIAHASDLYQWAADYRPMTA